MVRVNSLAEANALEFQGIHTEDDLRLFVRAAFGITIPDVQVCPDHSTPWRAFSEAFFARAPVSVWIGARGFSGKTFTLSLLSLCEAIALGADVNLLGGSAEQSNRVHDASTKLWSYANAPTHELKGTPIASETRFRFGNTLQALTASQRSVRGPHPQRLRCDEVDEMERGVLDAAMGQTMRDPQRPWIECQTVLSSTWHNIDGTMTEILRRASEKQWPVHRWCHRETIQPHGWLDPREPDRKRHEMTAERFANEIELGRPTQLSDQVFPQYGDPNRRSLEYNPNYPISLGIDFGFRSFCCYAAQIIDGAMYILASRIYHGLTTAACGLDVRDNMLKAIVPVHMRNRGDWCAGLPELIDVIGCDPAGDATVSATGYEDASTIQDLFRGCKVEWSTGRRFRDPEWRAEQLRTLIRDAAGTVRLFVDPENAKYADDCFSNAIYPKHTPGSEEKRKPLKDGVYDHGVDTAGYLGNAAMWDRAGNLLGVAL